MSAHKTKPNPLALIAGASLGLILIFLLRRYAGITHDSTLYLGQGLLQRWPEIYGSDLFFLHGSQEHYSLFPRLLGVAFGWLPPPAVFLWGTLICILLFAAASWWCLAMLLPPGRRYWAWLGTLALPGAYGMTSIFSINEAFLTPRSVAETLCLCCLALLAGQRWGWAVLCWIAAATLHPLQALGAALVMWPWAILQDRRWGHAAWLAVPMLGLANLGIPPFDDLLNRIDTDWKFSIHESTPQLFITAWSSMDIGLLTFDAMVLGHAAHRLRGSFGRWCLAALIGLGLGVGATLALVDGLSLVLPAGLQFWRSHWLAHWFAIAAFAILLVEDLKQRERERAVLLMTVGLIAWVASPWGWFPLALLYGFWPRIFEHLNPRLKRIVAIALAIGMCLILANYVAFQLLPFRMAHYRLDLYAFDRKLLIFPVFALGLPILGAWLWRRATASSRRLVLLLVVAPVIALGAWRWDARPFMNRAFEGHAFDETVFGSAIPEDAQVYWEGDSLIGTWLVLHRASYFNAAHFAGQIFNRDTALDGRYRANRLSTLIDDSIRCQDRARPYHERAYCRISEKGLSDACRPGRTRAPDYLVLPYLQTQPSLGHWSVIDPITNEPAVTYRLYSCAEILAYQTDASGVPREAAAPLHE